MIAPLRRIREMLLLAFDADTNITQELVSDHIHICDLIC
jgi:hypothetical protein